MRLAWHLCKKDFRLFRGLLGYWWGLLAADLLLNLWLPGHTEFQRGGGAFPAEMISFLWGWVRLLLWAGALLLPLAAVFADSPIRENGFLRTRPVPRPAILGGKALFIGLCLLTPAVLSELLHLGLAGAGVGRAIYAAGERLLFLGPLTLAAAVLGGLWVSRKELRAAKVGLAVGLLAAFMGTYLLAGLMFKWGWISRRPTDPQADQLLLWSVAVAVGWTLILARAWRHEWSFWRRGSATLAVGGAALLFALLPAWNLFPLRPTHPATDARLLPAARLKLSWPEVRTTLHLWPSGTRLQTTVYPRPPMADPDVVVDWRPRTAEWRFADGHSLPVAENRRTYPLFGRQPLTVSDFRAFAHLIGPDILFLRDRMSMPQAGTALGVTPWDAPPAREATLHATLDGRVFRWVKAARLPLKAGAHVRDAAGGWTLIGRDPARLVLRRDQFALRTTSKALFRRLPNWPGSQYAFVTVDRRRGIALRQASWQRVWMSLGGHTAVAHYFLSLQVDYPRLLRETGRAELTEAELWIFRREYLGSREVEVVSPRLDLGQLQPLRDEPFASSNFILTESEFRRRLAALTPPPPGSGRAVWGHYLARVLQLVEARRFFPDENDPLVRQLAKLAAERPALFLDALPLASPNSARLLQAALRRGLSEAQADRVVAALPGNLKLAGLILARGWEERARPLVSRLVEAPDALPLAAIQLLAAGNDPAIHPRLLAELERHPSPRIYEILRTLDGLGPMLDQTLDRIARDCSRPLDLETESFATEALLMRAGRRTALERLLRLFHLAPVNQHRKSGLLLEALKQGIRFDGLDPSRYHDAPALVAWLRDKQVDDFVWDPLCRRFRLRTAMPPAATSQP